jgi:hypothetical protein
VDLHRRAADVFDVGIDLERVADLHRADELHGVERDGDDAAVRALDAGDAAGLVHAREHPAAEYVAVGVGVRRHGADAHRERAARGGVGGHVRISPFYGYPRHPKYCVETVYNIRNCDDLPVGRYGSSSMSDASNVRSSTSIL